MLILFCNLAFNYLKYCKFDQSSFRNATFLVANEYEKTSRNGRKYQVLKLKNDNLTIYATWFKKAFLKRGDFVNLNYKPTKVTFKAYLQNSFLAQTKNIKRVEAPKRKSFKDRLALSIANQHKDQTMKELFSTLYLATDFDISLRNSLNKWGISHLIVISGYHMVLIFSVVYFVLKPVYKIFQQRLFPYRNAKFDISILIFVILFSYLCLVGFPPSFLRSFCMSILAFVMLAKNIKITSFKFLFLIYLALISTNLNLLFSVGFYFSCMGVFYIYLYIHHFKDLVKNIFLNFIFFNIFVYYVMNIPVFYFFPMMSFYQPSVVPISFIFNGFYPLSIILHFFGAGGCFDECLLKFLNYEIYTKNIVISKNLFLIYNALSFASIFSKSLAVTLLIISLVVTYTF